MGSATMTECVFEWSNMAPDAPMPLLERRRVIGEKVMISQVLLRKGCDVPTHAHENEQMSCLLSGALKFGLGERGSPGFREVTVKAGQIIHLRSNLPHSALALEDTVVLDVFAPPSATTGIDRR